MQTVDRLSKLESIVDKSRRSFYDLGKALREIRDNRLYRYAAFNTFNDYARKRWAIGKSHAYRLIEACNVIDNLSPIGDVLPVNESQVRPLVPFTPHERQHIWSQFLDSELELTAANIRRLVANLNKSADRPVNQPDRTSIISENYKEVAMAMIEQIRLAQNDGWQSTSQEAALFWLRIMKDKILQKASQKRKQ